MDALLHLGDAVLAPLRPYLTPITHNLPAPITTFIDSLIGPTCTTYLLHDLSLSASPACSTLLISKLLGYAILSLSLIVKLPQLLKLLRSRSAAGVSFASYALETVAYAITLAYNVRSGNPVSTYGEIAVIAVQNVAVAGLVLYLQGRRAAAGGWVVGVAVLAGVLLQEAVGMGTLKMLQALTIPLGIASKLPQIWTVARERSTGQLSAFAVFNYLGGSLARVFTTLAEVDDAVILVGYVAGAALNAVLAAQMVWFWNAAKPVTAEKKRA